MTSEINKIAYQIKSQIFSFSSGVRVDHPTFALIGDASRQGGKNREWIYRDEHLIATVQMASAGSNAMLLREIREPKSLMDSQGLTTTSGEVMLLLR